MNNPTKNTFTQAFSLVELMVVLSIIGLLVSLALPRYNGMKIRAARLEAKQNLNAIYTLQVAFHAENDRYGDLDLIGLREFNGNNFGQCDTRSPSLNNEIGFHVPDACKLRYMYSSEGGRDEYNQNSNCNIASCFSAQALAYADTNLKLSLIHI